MKYKIDFTGWGSLVYFIWSWIEPVILSAVWNNEFHRLFAAPHIGYWDAWLLILAARIMVGFNHPPNAFEITESK